MSSRSPTAWLHDQGMNLLVDYYTEVPFRPYGTGATRDNVLPWLRQLELGYLCVYAKGHSGYTTWPSSLRTQHTMLGQDACRFFRDVTREAGCRLVLYYSGMLDGIAGLRHPDWRMRLPDGSDQRLFDDFKVFTSYANCPLSPYWDEWVSVQLHELLRTYEPDGIWVDGDWAGPCHCPRCRERFRQETGWHEPWSDLAARADFAFHYNTFWTRVTHEWRTRFAGAVKAIAPECAYSAGNVSPRREFAAPFDWRSGDFFSPGFFRLHEISQMMRWYATLGVPYDAYVCDTSFTHARKAVRSRSKTLDRMLQEAATVAACGGAVGYWTYPLGNGAFVPSRLEKAVAVRRFLREREGVFVHTEPVPWTLILASDPSQPAFGTAGVKGAHKALAALHLSPLIADETAIARDLPYDLVVLPEQAVVPAETMAALRAYAEGGGTLLTSGAAIESDGLRTLLGVTAVRRAAVADGHVLLRTSREPTGIDQPWDRLELEGGSELYPLYLSWDQLNPECRNLPNNWPMHGQVDEEHPEPAGFPAAVWRQVGRGRLVHLCTGVFGHYDALGDPQILRWLREVLDGLLPEPLFRTTAPSWVDVSLRRRGRDLLVHLVNGNPGRDLSRLQNDDTWVDEIPEVGPYLCEVRRVRPGARVTWEPGGASLEATVTTGALRFAVPRFQVHGCAVITEALT